ncbi:MAG TPA: HIT domain-containing protein [Terrimicrobiaceae bacterium]
MLRNRDCCLCDQIEGLKANDLVAHMLPDVPYVRRVMLESRSFAVIPSLGPLASGHSLLCPRNHIKSFASISPDLHEEYGQLKKKLRTILNEIYGTGIHLFEHGMATKGNRIVCTVDHAHMHFLPLPQTFEIDANGLQGWTEFDGSLSELLKLTQDREYIVYETPDGVCRLLTAQEGALESQYMRKVLAKGLGHRKWDWRAAPNARAADEAFRRFSEAGLR